MLSLVCSDCVAMCWILILKMKVVMMMKMKMRILNMIK